MKKTPIKQSDKKIFFFSSVIILSFLLSVSFKKSDDAATFFENNDEIFLPVLSGYNLYEGNLINLTPSKGVELYELTSHLFVDYAEKQRLIKLPVGSKMTFKGNGLPDFPDGTILVKTFYWYKDKKNPSIGRNIIETRLLIKSKLQWKVGTYKWNSQQTEAHLITTGNDVNVEWIDLNGEEKKFLFHIPSNIECSECHQSNEVDLPIGPKLSIMNFDVYRNETKVNQLKYFQNIGWLDSVKVATISSLPNYENAEYSLEKRARAYLDMNCAHCHNAKGSASIIELRFDYETPFDSTGILLKNAEILKRMQSVDEDLKMPNIGTSVIDAEGLELIIKYINSLN